MAVSNDGSQGRRTTRHSSTPPGQFNSIDEEGRRRAFIIGVTGGTASGKTTVCRKIMEFLGQGGLQTNERVAIISQDSFYCDLDEEQRKDAAEGNYNFDHPDSFDNPLMIETLQKIQRGEQVHLPVYDFKTHTRNKTEYIAVPQADVVLFEGILVLYSSELREMMQMKIFVDTDSDTRLARRILRDINERGRTLESVIDQYTTFVKSSFEDFTLPTKKYADVIIPRGAENDVAINLIGQHIWDILSGKVAMNDNKKSLARRRSRHASESSVLTRPH